MKLPLPFTIYDLGFTIGKKSSGVVICSRRDRLVFNLQSSIAHRKSASGVALVITLIMLSVTLIMAVAFLAVARRERNAVSITTDTATARLAADAALAAAQAQMAANIFSSTNAGAYDFHLLVSTNYINYLGYTINSASPTNVNYEYYLNGTPGLAPDDRNQNIANLLFLPRAPVVVGSNDFRFYLDLNRSARFEGNGMQPQIGINNGFLHPNGTEDNSAVNVVTNFMTGDPEWIGVLERPDQPHGPNNKFLARYAFLAQPIGNSLDLNAIHNQVFDEGSAGSLTTVNPPSSGDAYFRNQGVGSWELNLAAFLADLNTNRWNPPTILNAANNPYFYNPKIFGIGNSGVAFEDARALLAYRYNNDYASLASANFSLFNAANVYPFDNIDEYSDGPPQNTTTNIVESVNPDRSDFHWVGSDNTNRFYTLLNDLFDVNKTALGVSPALIAANNDFTGHLLAAGNGNATYDRYTFYRMLDQLGTDSAPDRDKLNLNYSNAVVSYTAKGEVADVATIPGAEQNLVAWTATNFFTAAADRMLRTYTTNWFVADPTNYLRTYYGINPPGYLDGTGRGVTNLQYFGQTNELPAFGLRNIPVQWNGNFVYTPAVNRVLQLAANLYDASTNSFYPSVFRPIFEHDNNGNIFIVGYTGLNHGLVPNTVSGTADPQLSLPYDVTALLNVTPADFTPITDGNGHVNVYGVPWIIGAKKNLPGLNQFSLVNSAQFTRKLQIGRNFIGGPIWTNQLVLMSISNNLGVSFWNSYANDYTPNYSGPLNLSIVVNQAVRLVVTNSDWGNTTASYLFATNYTIRPTRWPGTGWGTKGSGSPSVYSFIATNWANEVVSPAAYNFTTKTFDLLSLTPNPWDINRTIVDPLPQFGVLTTNWVQAYIVDGTHVIDYVQLRGPIDGDTVNGALKDPDLGGDPNYYLWVTNGFNGAASPTWGIVDQIDVSSKPVTAPAGSIPTWNPVNVPGLNGKSAQEVYFAAVLQPNSTFPYATKDALGNTVNYIYTNTQLIVQAPYTAFRTVYVPYLYQVNDPLVHYTVNDLDAGLSGVWAGGYAHTNGVWDKIDNSATAPFPAAPTKEIIQGRYQPWGKGAPTKFLTSSYNFGNPYNPIYKDPLVWGSDYWDFPTNRYPTAGWIGRVHRGTPWQTVYLKSQNVLHASPGASGTNTWKAWTGDYNTLDAANSAPIRDRVLFDLFTTAPNDNASRGQLSVNQTHLAAWSALFSGLVAITNTGVSLKTTPSYAATVINPAGVGGLNSALGTLVTNINYARSIFTNADGVAGVFEHKGDILSAPALTEQSPFLNLTTKLQLTNGISDEVYEWLPQQMLSLLNCPTGPRYVVYCYGQTLRPAPNGTVLSGPMFNLITNYQVTAESAARAVIRLDKHVTLTGTNYSTVVESYNVLPPD